MNRSITALLVCGAFFGIVLPPTTAFAEDPPAPPAMGRLLNRWRFDDTSWLSARGDTPLAFTNLTLPASWNTNCLEVDSPEPAFLQYRCQPG